MRVQPWNGQWQKNNLIRNILTVKILLCILACVFSITIFNPLSAGTAFMLMQTGWIQASRRVTRRLAWIQPVCISINAVPALKRLKIVKLRKHMQE